MGLSVKMRALSFAAALILLTPALASAGGTQCSSSEAAESLVSCDHCQEWKELLGRASDISVTVNVHELSRGVIIDFAAGDEQSAEFIRSAVATLWGMSDETGGARVTDSCSYCDQRSRKLQSVERDHAITERGAFVILTSDDDTLVEWSRQDAQSLQSLIERSASSH